MYCLPVAHTPETKLSVIGYGGQTPERVRGIRFLKSGQDSADLLLAINGVVDLLRAAKRLAMTL